MIDRLIAHLAEGATAPDTAGMRPSGAVVDCVTGVCGTLATDDASLSLPIDVSVVSVTENGSRRMSAYAWSTSNRRLH
jgi:hypothetical protein